MSAKGNWQQNVMFGDPIGVPYVDATFDYVVVGGGTAGLVIASRLAEDPAVSVAVVEAGGFYELDNGQGSMIPALAPAQSASTDPKFTAPQIDWGFVTTPGSEVNNRTMHYARGKTLGGSSALNFMAYNRGTRGTHQAWADMVGDQSYNWDNFLRYFKKSTTLTPPDYSIRQPDGKVSYDPTAFDNSSGGPLTVTWAKWASRCGSGIIKAMSEAGIPETDSFDNGDLLGVAWSASTIDPRTSIRCSSKIAYLDKAIEKTDIKVYARTMAEKILFDNNTATGVLVNTDGKVYKLNARKEVIVCAGAFQSPQILMVSGVGPKAQLEQFGIPVVSDLESVGQNLRDHCFFGISHQVNRETISKIMSEPAYAQKVAEEFATTASGPLSAPHGTLAFEKITGTALSSLSEDTQKAIAQLPADWPEIEYLEMNIHCGDCTNFVTGDPANGNNYLTLCGGLMTALSKGSITISSASTSDPPIIDPGYLTHPAEVEIAVAAFKRVRQIWDKASDMTVGDEYYPGRDKVQTDEQIVEFIKDNLCPIFHASCTCAMGKEGDKNAVVDSQARVFGTNGLRVVDASVLPVLPPCHPQATIYALAEKIADDIKGVRNGA